MIFTRINEIPVSKSVIATFKGYNHNLRIGTGEFYDMKNMTSDHYPVLSTRTERKDIETMEDIIVAAVNEAIKRVEDTNSSEMQKITGSLGMGMPGGMF